MLENSSSTTAQDANIDASVAKMIGLGVVNILAAAFLAFTLRQVFADGGVSARNILGTTIANLLFLSCVLLQVFFVKSMKVQSILVLLEALVIASPFVFYWSGLFLLALALLILFMMNGLRSGMKEMDNEMAVRFKMIERKTLPAIITGLSLFISIIYLAINGTGASFLSKDAFAVMMKPVDPIAQSLLMPGFSVNMTMTELAQAVAVRQLGTTFTSLTPDLQSQALEAILTQLRGQAATYGVSFTDSETVSDVLYSYFVRQFNQIPNQYRSLLPYVILILTFITVKSLGALLRWLIIPLAYALYQFLLATGFARISLESRSRQIITLG
ncbi:hypothetical protein KGO95_02645 [Patescibacteria group bacterium]|nr:hypothetical protein [Patescibacteria group bacterium]